MATPVLIPERILSASVPWVKPLTGQPRFVPCALCGGHSLETLASVVINWTEFFIVKCRNCKLIWRNPIPDEEFQNDLYGEPYFDVSSYAPELIDQVGIADTDETDQFKRRQITTEEVRDWSRNRRLLARDGNGQPKRLLEIGGGRGYLQRAATEAGWSTMGLEISPHGIKEAIRRGLVVFPIVLEELCSKYLPYTKHFDAIVFFDFLEHVTDPGRVLRMVASILKDEGVIILRVPCIEEEERPKWHLIDHIWHFTNATVEALLVKEGFYAADSHESGRFPGPDGQVSNWTYFARKTVHCSSGQ